MKPIEIAGLGFCSLDYLSILPYIPMDEKVEIIQNLIQGGGPTATAIITAARLGANTAFIGCVGDDEKGKTILQEFEKETVDTKFVQVNVGKKSPSAFCWIEKSTGKRSIAWTKGTILPLDATNINYELIASLKLLHLDGHNTEAAIIAAKIAKENDVLVSLDAGTNLPGIDELIQLSDICIAPENFALKYTGENNIQKAAEKLLETNCIVAAVTSGKDGVFAITSKGSIIQRAFEVEVVDTTGAGDVFHGAFAYAFIQGWEINKVVEFASATAAIKCMQLGGRTGIPSLSEVNEFLAKQINYSN